MTYIPLHFKVTAENFFNFQLRAGFPNATGDGHFFNASDKENVSYIISHRPLWPPPQVASNGAGTNEEMS